MANAFYQYRTILSSENETLEEEYSEEEFSEEEASEKEFSEEEFSEEEASEKEFSEEETSEEVSSGEPSNEDTSEEDFLEAESSEENSEECLENFRRFFNEDVMVFKLYKRQVQEIGEMYDIGATECIEAVFSMIKTISEGHKHSFHGFSGLEFNEPRNHCAYLLRYAATHTGLVRKAMWNIFRRDLLFVDRLKSKNELNIVSLGGGPGNDILGFCGALREFPNFVTSFDFTIVDVKDGWSGVLDSLIGKTKSPEFQNLSFSKILKNVTISSNFILANLINEKISENEELTNALNAADVVLMVKLVSFHSSKERSQMIMNVCEAMRNWCILVFIDCPYPRECFQSISCVRKIYEEKILYKFDSSSCSASGIINIKKSQAIVAVFVKV